MMRLLLSAAFRSFGLEARRSSAVATIPQRAERAGESIELYVKTA